MTKPRAEKATSDNLQAYMAFARPADVQPDDQQAGVLRAKTRPVDANTAYAFDLKPCKVRDWSAESCAPLNLETMGFDALDLSHIDTLQATLESIRSASHITKENASVIRRQMQGQSFKLSSGKQIKLLSIAPEGLVMRQAGPNGCKVSDEAMSEMNGHDGALTVHADQDVHGTPLKQMMRGAAPWIFRHQSPQSNNKLSPVFLVNIWIPLQQITRPLTLMDRRTLDKKHHQLRYALPTDDFLDRGKETRVNDIWAFLHDDEQQWYFNSDMNAGNAYIFDTLGTPHGAIILPGEEIIEQYFFGLKETLNAISNDDDNGMTAALEKMASLASQPISDATTKPIENVIATMADLVAEAKAHPQTVVLKNSEWQARAEHAVDSVVRKSIEMRGVAIQTPDVWPLNLLSK